MSEIIRIGYTERGFAIGSFIDRYGVECSIQESSLATEGALWLGCDDADPKHLVKGKGWQPVDMPDEYTANTRMHLTQDMVSNLIPLLPHFVDTGELPSGIQEEINEQN